MAATLYYVLCVTADGKICDERTTNTFSDGLIGVTRHKATFSANAGDSPDVTTPAGKPGLLGTLLVNVAGSPATLSVAGADANGAVDYSSVFNGDTDSQIAHVVGDTGVSHKNRTLAVSVSGQQITVTFGTDSEGVSVVPTATEVAAAVNAHAEASKWVSAAAGGTGASAVGTTALTALAGGTKDTFTYTAPVCPTLKLTWSGNGAADPDDGVYEMTSDGVNSMTLTVQKWDKETDTAIQEAGDTFEVCPVGATASPSGRITLDANGEATLVFTPPAADKGAVDIILRPISADCQPEGVARARLI